MADTATGDKYGATQFRVHTRALWGAGWTEREHLVPLTVTEAVAPDVATAELVYQFGKVTREGTSIETTEAELPSLANHFIRIQATAATAPVEADWSTIFYGWVQQEQINTHSPVSSAASGDHYLVAHGLEAMLDRMVLNSSVVADKGSVLRIGQVLPFNRRWRVGMAFAGNRSKISTPSSSDPSVWHYVFGDDNEAWTVLDLLEYVIYDSAVYDVPFRFSGQWPILRDIIVEPFRPSRLTAAGALNRFIDRRRGIGWCIRVTEGTADPADDIAYIHIFTVFNEPVTVGKRTIPANEETATFDTDNRHDLVGPPQVAIDHTTDYDWVLVRGGRFLSCFSVGFGEDSLAKGWSQADEDYYVDTAGDEARGNDNYSHVFGRYVIPNNWNWRSADGAGLIRRDPHPISPLVKRDGSIVYTEEAPHKSWGHRLERDVPLPTGIDVQSGEQDYKVMLVAYLHGSNWHEINTPPEGLPAFTVTPLDNAMGFKLSPMGKLPHVLALGHAEFTNSKTVPELDYEYLVATVSMVVDEVPHVYEPITTPDDIDKPSGRVLVIEVPDAEIWWINSWTVLGISAQNSLTNWLDVGATLRDDTPRLREIAALAKGWYSQARQSARFTQMQIQTDRRPGSFLTVESGSFTRETVGTIVTGKSYDCQANRTTFVTSYEDLDFGAFF